MTAIGIEIAEYTWIKSIQKDFFKEKSNLKQFEIKLGVYLDTDNIYKCEGRLINSSFLEYSKTPIFLPKESYLSNLITLKVHQNLKHSGVKGTINHIRSIYWIIKLRKLVRSVIRKFILCRRFESKPYPNLPRSESKPYLRFKFPNFAVNGLYHLKRQVSIILDLYL